ncbi:hypothetical protein P775_00410 [Puniceibacterium antarcticum]|uniref:Uncharacterized protein n=1 Tax=Puniceibacterium antarcticum TaxID=1206336 RepID=A0A2G8RL84_9RHOB|nr:hypothetical protein [Puniceibacterium antarcticum]PIL22221.1 hypothetical protein P775_00410 [Puniceibacterium antarcticum]
MCLKTNLLRRGLAIAVTTAGLAVPVPQAARAYQIDCAILICLAGGWPSSAECNTARSVFMRRITPWPVEPPLQLWNCPLGAAMREDQGDQPLPRLHDIADRETVGLSPVPFGGLDALGRLRPEADLSGSPALSLIAEYSHADGAADVDISGGAYDFVRSIRVFNVEYARQWHVGGDADICRRSQRVRRGTYGVEGRFGWESSSVAALPGTFEGLSGWGRDCPGVSQRAVFVDWRDYDGNYGYEQIEY